MMVTAPASRGHALAGPASPEGRPEQGADHASKRIAPDIGELGHPVRREQLRGLERRRGREPEPQGPAKQPRAPHAPPREAHAEREQQRQVQDEIAIASPGAATVAAGARYRVVTVSDRGSVVFEIAPPGSSEFQKYVEGKRQRQEPARRA